MRAQTPPPAAFAGEFALYNSSGTQVPNSQILSYYNTGTTNQAGTGSGRIILTTTGSSTYTMRAWASTGRFSSFNDANGTTGVTYVQLTGGYIGATGPTGATGPVGLIVPAWTYAGTIQNVGWGATTSAPVVGNTTKNSIQYRQLGLKEWEIVMSFTTGTGGIGNNGSGDYLFTLPINLSFDTSLDWQKTYTGNVDQSSSEFMKWTIPMSYGSITDGTTNSSNCYIVPYDSNKYRIITFVPLYGTPVENAIRAWGSGWYSITSSIGGNFAFRFTST